MSSSSDTPRPSREDIQRVFQLYSARRLPEALAETQRLLSRYPRAPLLLNIRGAIHAGLGQLDDAVESYASALEISPEVAESYFHLGNALAARGDRLDALAAFQRAVELKPDFVEAHGNVCRELERAHQIEALRRALAQARRLCPPDHPLLQLRQAELARHDGDLAAARGILEALLTAAADPDVLEAGAYLLAEVCDRLEDTDAAFVAATQANQQSAAGYAAGQISSVSYLDQIGVLTTQFSADWVARWQQHPETDALTDPVFLVGFPRSGTTLLDSVLRSHPAIDVVEEQPMVSKLERAVSELPGGYPGALAELSAGQLAQLRAVYFEELARHLDPDSQAPVVVDKLPLNLVHAGLLQRVFPGARFVFALRHPCDSVLSCYLRAFELNEGMVNFLQLEDAAKLYDKTMHLWQRYRDVLPLAVHTVRYETLIDSPQETLTPLLQTLGLDWDPAMNEYAKIARSRGDIQTPSYHQVTEAIYTRARYRWQRYSEQLAPVLPLLTPWAQHWGYEDEGD